MSTIANIEQYISIRVFAEKEVKSELVNIFLHLFPFHLARNLSFLLSGRVTFLTIETETDGAFISRIL